MPTGLAQINYRVRTILTTGIVGQWSFPAPFYFGSGNQETPQAAQSAHAESAHEGGEGGTLTIEDAQMAKGKDKAG